MASPPPLRPRLRERRRQETIGEVKAVARDQLAAGGPSAISLRGIARVLGVAASAIHYYFPSRQALLDALVVDGFTSLGEALRDSYQASLHLDADQRWLTVCRAHRAWALEHRSEYLLLYGEFGGLGSRVDPAALRAISSVLDVLFSLMRDALAEGAIDVDRIATNVAPSLRRQLRSWRQSNEGIADMPEGALAACMIGFAQLHGAIALELLGHVPPQLGDASALFDFRMAHIAMSLHPISVKRRTL